jgi:hypothetical protein
MPRKRNPKAPFAYEITIYDRETYEAEQRRRRASKGGLIHQSDRWRAIRHEDAIMFFTFQILRLKQQIRRPWYCYYKVTGYGAPGHKEFLCPFTFMKATTIQESQAKMYRQWYACCIEKSRMILKWLIHLPSTEYTQDLHHYLLRLLIFPRPTTFQVDVYKQKRESKISRALFG